MILGFTLRPMTLSSHRFLSWAPPYGVDFLANHVVVSPPPPNIYATIAPVGHICLDMFSLWGSQLDEVETVLL